MVTRFLLNNMLQEKYEELKKEIDQLTSESKDQKEIIQDLLRKIFELRRQLRDGK